MTDNEKDSATNIEMVNTDIDIKSSSNSIGNINQKNHIYNPDHFSI
mgnify:FL=1|jgi:hypothetical protein